MQKEDFTCIAVDMGAGSIRVMLGVISKTAVSYREIHRFDNEIVHQQGCDRWDMIRIVTEIHAGIEKAIDSSKGRVCSIGVDSWGVDFVLLDRSGSLLEQPVAYRDKRTEGMHDRWRKLMTDQETFRRTGINFYVFNTLFQLLAMKDSAVLESASSLLFMPCYINYLLSGVAKNERTIASTSQLLAVDGREWDAKILGKLGVPEELLGGVIEPGTCLGPVTGKTAGGHPIENVAVCGHDTAAVVVAIPAENSHFAYLSAGTWCIVGIESDRPLLTGEALELGFTNERGFGNSFRVLKNIVGLWLLQGLKRHLPEQTSYQDMEEMTMEGGETELVIDPDDPLFYNPQSMKEAFDTYFSKTNQSIPADFSAYLRCAYDSLCFSFRYYIEKLEQHSGQTIQVLHMVGGGSQSAFLNQRVADICERRVIAGPVEGATLGNMIVQAMALGRIDTLDQGRKLIRQSFPGRQYLPEKVSLDARKRYDYFLNLKHTQI
ncbi:MAG: rhamnulokinase family protein [Bacteroidota bacterium]